MTLSAADGKKLGIILGSLTLAAILVMDYLFRTILVLVFVALGLVAINLIVVAYLNKRGTGASG